VSSVRDWDAATYDRVSAPQVAFARALLRRMPLRGDETVLDAGCGTGRVTELLLERLPAGRVVAVDAGPAMVEQARRRLQGQAVQVLQSDLTELVLDEPVDAVFSSAVFHWIADHDALFARLHAVLRPGGRLVAQCGGRGNIARLRDAAGEVAEEPPFAAYLADAPPVWNYAGPEETERRLEEAGFSKARCWLEPFPVTPPEPRLFLQAVCLGPYVELLPEEHRDAFAEAVSARLPSPLVLEYVRLNIAARRPDPRVR
jgi:trans-aconitate 2-methyltransferase